MQVMVNPKPSRSEKTIPPPPVLVTCHACGYSWYAKDTPRLRYKTCPSCDSKAKNPKFVKPKIGANH